MSINAADRAQDANPRTSMDVRRQRVAESLRVGNPANNARDLPAQADPLRECQIELGVDEIRRYENNPRRADNARFQEIRDSIRASGLRNPITVTRRPGEGHFIVEAGGNTRLLAIQQLWRETGDARFARLTVLFRPWRSESHVLISHFIENEQRGEMTFWDKASGMAMLKSMLESERGRAYTVRAFEADLKTAGITISTSTLSHYGFATGRLGALGSAAHALSGLDVRKLQLHLNLARRHAQTRAALPEEALYSEVLAPVFRKHEDAYHKAGRISTSALCRDCEAALALRLHEPVSELRTALAAIVRSPAPAGVAAECAGKRLSANPAAAARGDDVEGDRQDAPKLEFTAVPAKGLAARQAIEAGIRHFAELAGIAACLQTAATAPCGIVVDAMPPGVPPSPLQGRARQLLSLICNGTETGTHRGRPEDAESVQSELPFSRALLGWLLDTTNDAACAYWAVLVLVRETGVLSGACDASAVNRPAHRETV